MNGANAAPKATAMIHTDPTRAPHRAQVSSAAWRRNPREARPPTAAKSAVIMPLSSTSAVAPARRGFVADCGAASIDIAHPRVRDRIQNVRQQVSDQRQDADQKCHREEQFAIPQL